MNAILETIVRESYAKMIAYLAARHGRDIAAAEDALADAMASALAVWPESGLPQNAEAWLMRAAQNRLIDLARRRRVMDLSLQRIARPPHVRVDDLDAIPDERLQLLFACAHPAIDGSVRTPLLLQAVLGLSAEAIAPAFLVAPKTMSQRLVRAKSKIRDAGISFEMPDRDQWASRLQTVLDAIYAAYGTGWDGLDTGCDLVEEAIRLARIVVELLPDAAESLGLLAMLLYSHARRNARRSPRGAFVPLAEQDTARWDRGEISEAEGLLQRASSLEQFGRYQLEAAIQSAHVQRRHGVAVPWHDLVRMYDVLTSLAPTPGVLVSRAGAMASAGDLRGALAALDLVHDQVARGYQPYWAVRAQVLQQLAHPDTSAAYDRAIGLCTDAAVRAYLTERRLTRAPQPC